MKQFYTATLLPLEDGGYAARVPDVPGCVTTGRNLEEAITYAQDALGGCLLVLEDEHQPLPQPRLPQDVPCPADGVRIVVGIDLLQFRARSDSHAVRKNVSIPSWMATMADLQGVNVSQVLQEALRARFDRE